MPSPTKYVVGHMKQLEVNVQFHNYHVGVAIPRRESSRGIFTNVLLDSHLEYRVGSCMCFIPGGSEAVKVMRGMDDMLFHGDVWKSISGQIMNFTC